MKAGGGLGLALLLSLVLAAQAQKPKQEPRQALPMRIESTAFRHQGSIPVEHTCEGANRSPALSWDGVPEGTQSLVIIVDDPDAPDPRAPKMTWVHWVLFNVPPISGGLTAGIKRLPPGTGEGLNDWKKTGYRGPCPPRGRHRYFHKLYALDSKLELDHPSKAQVEAAMAGHVLATAELVGTYQKSGK